MSLNFNDLVPAPPAGATNIKFQRDVSGNASAYIQTPSTIVGSLDLAGQTADFPTTLLFTPPAPGMYRITVYLIPTVAATISGQTPATVVSFNDGDTGMPLTGDITFSDSSNVAGLWTFGSLTFYAGPTAAISVSSSNYLSSGATALTYSAHVRLEAL